MPRRTLRQSIELACIAIAFLICGYASELHADKLVVRDAEGKEKTLNGEVIAEARDKSILFQTTDGALAVFSADRIVSRTNETEKVAAMTHEELGKSLLQELPEGFAVHHTEHYVIAYQTNLAFAKWIANLYEKKLYKRFKTFARKNLRGYKLTEPEFPLPVVVFQTKPEYARYVKRELGSETGSMVAHYNQNTNRVAMYDLTFDFGNGGFRKQPSLEEVFSRPAAIPMVATIIHEGTHQLMYNRGMQTRLADGPLWLNEGVANWFETPNVNSGQGWQYPGLKNGLRLDQFRQYAPNRPADSLKSLISTDERFENPDTVIEAYAESWALVYFLIATRKTEFRDYLADLSKKRVGFAVDAQTRIADFEKHFGDVKELDRLFLKYISRQ